MKALGFHLALVLASCVAAPPPASAPPPPPTFVPPVTPTTPCAKARALRDLARARLAQGRLERTVRTVRAADRVCPSESPLTRPLLLTTLVDLGRYGEARSLAAIIENDPSAPGDARLAAIEAKARLEDLDRPSSANQRAVADQHLAAARSKAATGQNLQAKHSFLEAWKAFRPNGPALLGAALAAQALGDAVEARRLFDRAGPDFERGSGLRLELEVPNGFGGFVEALGYGVSNVVGIGGNNDTIGSKPVLAVAHRSQISVLDATSLRERLRLRGHEGTVIAVRLLADGLTLVSAARDGTARTWDLRTGKEILRYSGHTGQLHGMALTEDEAVLVTVAADGAARVFDRATGALLASLPHGSPARAAAFSPGSTELAVATEEGRVVLWDWKTQTKLKTLTGHKGAVRSVIHAGGLVLTAGDDDTVRSFDRKSGAEKVGTGHTAPVVAIALSRDGKRVASASLDQTVRIWTRDLAAERTLSGHTAMALSLAFSPDGTALASGDFDTVHVWDPATGSERARVERHTHTVSAVAFVPGAATLTLAIGAGDGTVRLWSAGGLRRFLGHGSTVTALAPDPSGAWLASGGLDGRLRRWSVEPFNVAPLADVAAGSVQALAVAPDGKTLVVATPDKSLRRFDLALETKDDGKGPGAYGAVYSPDGARVAFAAIGKVVIVRDATTFAETMRLSGHTGSVSSVAWSSDGATIASGGADKAARLWDAKTGAVLATLPHPEPVLSVAFRPSVSGDTAWLATGAADGSVRLFTAQSGKELMRIAAHTDAVTSLAISPDGRFLLTGGKDGSAHLFGLPDAQLRLSLRGISSSDAGYAFAPNGEFMGFGEVRDYSVCRLGATAVRYELCDDRFASDDLLELLALSPK